MPSIEDLENVPLGLATLDQIGEVLESREGKDQFIFGFTGQVLLSNMDPDTIRVLAAYLLRRAEEEEEEEL